MFFSSCLLCFCFDLACWEWSFPLFFMCFAVFFFVFVPKKQQKKGRTTENNIIFQSWVGVCLGNLASFAMTKRASRSLSHRFFCWVFFCVFSCLFFEWKLRGLKNCFLGFLAALGANMADFGAQLGPQKGPKIELFRGPRGNLS